MPYASNAHPTRSARRGMQGALPSSFPQCFLNASSMLPSPSSPLTGTVGQAVGPKHDPLLTDISLYVELLHYIDLLYPPKLHYLF